MILMFGRVNLPTWRVVLLRLLPLDVYEEISYDMAGIFSAAYSHYPPAQETFGNLSIPRLQALAKEKARRARNYDPHADYHEMEAFIGRLYRFIRWILIAIVVVGLLSGASWVSLSRGLLRTLGSMSQILITILLGGSAILAVPAGIVLLYAELLSFNSFVIQLLNEQLAIGPGEMATRDEEKLAGYALWNSSLNGGAGIKLLAIFSVLWILSATPLGDPYEYIKEKVERNIDIFGQGDGMMDATKLTYHRIRTRKRRAKIEAITREKQ